MNGEHFSEYEGHYLVCKYCGREIYGGRGDWWHSDDDGRAEDGHFATPTPPTAEDRINGLTKWLDSLLEQQDKINQQIDATRRQLEKETRKATRRKNALG
jgi:hypothetical protein